MYEGHFHLERRPFAATPDPGCCFLTPTQAPLIQAVSRCIEHGQGIAILTGPAGIGKTLLGQVLLAESERHFTGVYLGTGQFPTRRALLQAILYELGQPYGGMTDQELRLELNTALRSLITKKDGLLLVLDEAHLFSDRLLEEVRLLADLAQHGVPLTRVVLSGNPEFEERLTSSATAAFNQRVACHVVLETLTRPESIAYLDYRISWAGGDIARLFEREALQLIADASDGVPRCLNQLADHSLMQTYLAGDSIVTTGLVRQTLTDLQRLPLRWNPSALHERTPRQSATVTTTIQEAEVPAASVVEITDDNSATCSFEFGAGDDAAQHVVAPVATNWNVADPVIETEAVSMELDFVEVFEPAFESEGDSVEDADGPPLFAWLAKPAPVPEDIQPTVEDDFSTSSFNIPARRRPRPQIVEHEVVSSEPLTGAELLGRRLSDLSRPAGRTTLRESFDYRSLPSVETVIDSYADLDSYHAPVFPRPAVRFPEVSIPKSRVTVQPAAADVALSADGILIDGQVSKFVQDQIERIHLTGSPLEQLDAICALLEQPEGLTPRGGVELITDYGIERIDVDLPAHASVPRELSAIEHRPQYVENWIGSTVVEVGRHMQQTLEKSFPELVDRERATKIEQLLDGIEKATRYDYDVVEPDRSHSPPTAAAPITRHFDDTHASVVPPTNHGYKNFFSILRRRQAR